MLKLSLIAFVFCQDVRQMERDHQKLMEAQTQVLDMFEGATKEDKEAFQKALRSGDVEEVRAILKKFEGRVSGRQMSAGLGALVSSSLGIFALQSDQDLTSMLRQHYRGTVFEGLFEKFPKLEVFIVKTLKDPNALPGLVRIVANRTKLIGFAVINIIVIVLNVVWRRKIKKAGLGFKKQLARMCLVKCFQFGFLAVYWKSELSPVASVFGQVFF